MMLRKLAFGLMVLFAAVVSVACCSGGALSRPPNGPSSSEPVSAGASAPSTGAAAVTAVSWHSDIRGWIVTGPRYDLWRAWVPTHSDVDRFEAGLGSALPTHEGWPPDKWANYKTAFTTYARQYSGTFGEKGEKQLHVLFACEEPEGWGHEEVSIVDGGLCYVDVYFDLADGTYTAFLNGGPNQWL